MKKVNLLLAFLFLSVAAFSQTLEELKTMKAEKAAILAEKQAAADAVKAEVAGLDAKIIVLSGWRKGVFGGLGLNFNNSDAWATNAVPNSSSAAISGAVNAFANRQADKYFWNNSGVVNLGWLKFDNKDLSTDETKIKRNNDVLRLASLYGYKLNKWIAISALGEYSSSVFNLNKPGVFDIGAGATLTPIQDLVIVIHPLNYHFAFADNKIAESTSALGAKIRADYARKFKGGISWNSTLTSFLPYGSAAANAPSLFEYTWLNTIGFNLWKGIGVGFTLGLRQADFETFRKTETVQKKGVTQSFNTLGLSYAF
jgi:hypothetical protein